MMVIGKVVFEGYKDLYKFFMLERVFVYVLLKRFIFWGSVVMVLVLDIWGDLEF